MKNICNFCKYLIKLNLNIAQNCSYFSSQFFSKLRTDKSYLNTKMYLLLTTNSFKILQCLSLSFQMGYTDRREVKQFQYTAWPDHGVPDYPGPFLQFLRRITAMNPQDAGAMITHCSAGVGRTGEFLVIDSML
jgi:protein tyrosine phosphatase